MGSRIQLSGQKFLLAVNGRPMIDWLIDLYRAHVSRIVLVVSPAGEDAARRRAESNALPIGIEIQQEPTGMLDAILRAKGTVAESGAHRVWITWCDQVAIHPDTVARLAELSDTHADAAIVMPVAFRHTPYIHFERDGHSRIVRVLQRREGDDMPELGEGDMGLFSVSRLAYLEDLPVYARSVEPGTATKERNFLPFIPWVASGQDVVVFPCIDEMEAVGINTPEDRLVVEAYLSCRSQR